MNFSGFLCSLVPIQEQREPAATSSFLKTRTLLSSFARQAMACFNSGARPGQLRPYGMLSNGSYWVGNRRFNGWGGQGWWP